MVSFILLHVEKHIQKRLFNIYLQEQAPESKMETSLYQEPRGTSLFSLWWPVS